MPSANFSKLAVPTERLRHHCAPVTATVPPDGSTVIGQADALKAVDLGLQIDLGDYTASHYNVVVVGPPNTGRTAKTLRHVRAHAAGQESLPPDTLMLFDFAEPRRPYIIRVPNGQGENIKKFLEVLGKSAATLIPTRLNAVRERRNELVQREVAKQLEEADKKIRAYGFTLVGEGGTRRVVALSLANPDQPLTKEEHDALPPDIREKMRADSQPAIAIVENAEKVINVFIQQVAEGAVKQDRDVALKEVQRVTNALRQMVGENPDFEQYVKHLEEAVVEFSVHPPEEPEGAAAMIAKLNNENPLANLLQRLQANILVNNAGVTHPPVVHVSIPNYSALFGNLNAHLEGSGGTVKIDHRLVEGGAFLQANGGYLVFDLGDLLRWGGGLAFLKLLKVIRTRRLSIEGKGKFVDAEVAIDFRSKEVPIDVRVILICDPALAHLVRQVDVEFDNLFRVNAEFDDAMPIAEAPAAYAAFVALCQKEGQPAFSPEATARLVEYGSRRAGSQNKATAEVGVLKDVVSEATHWAAVAGSAAVGPEHVRQAIDERFHRLTLGIRNYQRDFLDSGKMLIDYEGAKRGQINGLAVVGHSEEVSTGIPKRVTARAFAGPGKVVLVQREAELSGPTSNSAIAIIRGYLSGLYGREKPLGLAVQICFEQSYGGIEGDSASLAEVIAAVSDITGLPVDQRLAITGSMNQWGEAQPIGGVNEKIEGHFGTLQRRGLLRPGHGVVIPALNVDDLNLKEEVIAAQEQGLYQVYAVSHIDEALEIFLGRPAEKIHALAKKELNKGAGHGGPLSAVFNLFRRQPAEDEKKGG